MGFLDWLGSLFGGGQNSSAPPEQHSAPSNNSFAGLRPAPPAPPPMIARNPPAPARDPFRPSAPAPAANPFNLPGPVYTPPAPQQQQQGPWRQLFFQPPPANTPPPLDLQKPQLEEPMFQRGQKEAQKQVEQKQTASKQNNFFGDEDLYAPEQMSVDAYLTLTPMQRAAVDANTALVQAAEQDVASWAKQQVAGKAIDDKQYLDQVKDKFGDTGGSDTYAPRTMAVLEDLGLNLQGKDLDQYLNHSALVTDADLKLIGSDANVPLGGLGADPRQQNATDFAKAASNRLSETLATGQNLLDSLRTGSETGGQLFGKPTTTAPVGFSNNERDADLSQAFDILAQTRSQQDLTPETVGGLYAELQQKHGVTPNEVAKYFETRLESNEYLNAAENQDVSLGGAGSSLEYLSPQDFRSKFLKRGA